MHIVLNKLRSAFEDYSICKEMDQNNSTKGLIMNKIKEIVESYLDELENTKTIGDGLDSRIPMGESSIQMGLYQISLILKELENPMYQETLQKVNKALENIILENYQ